MTTKRALEPLKHNPSAADIRAAMRRFADEQRALGNEGAALYADRMKRGGGPEPALDDRGRAVRAHVALLLNGSTPPSFLPSSAPSREAQIDIEKEALGQALR